MTIDTLTVADEFLARGEADCRVIDPMKLQKLVYFAHGWMLGLTGNPLVSEKAEAWPYGPVFPRLYRAFSEFGADPIATRGRKLRCVDDDRARAVIDKVWQEYGGFDALTLSAMTHRRGTPWAEARKRVNVPWAERPTIPNDGIRDFFAAEATARDVQR